MKGAEELEFRTCASGHGGERGRRTFLVLDKTQCLMS